jgi:hypothetical protein
MAKFKNLGGACDLYKPAGEPDSCHVDAGAVVTVPGDAQEQGDAWLCKGLAWPKSRWELQQDAPAPVEPTPTPAPVLAPAPEKEN